MKKRIAILLVLALVLALSGCKSSDYKQAVTAMDAGNYQEALTALDALGDYKDAADLAVKCRYAIAEDNFDKGEYETALTQFTDLGDYRDSGKYVTKCNYALAVKAFEDKDYTKAQDLFTGLADYQDSESYLEKTENALLLQAVAGTWKSGNFDLFPYLVDSMGLMENAWNTVTSDGTLPQANAVFTLTIDENGEYGVECTIGRSENFSEVFKDMMVRYMKEAVSTNLAAQGYTLDDLYAELGTEDWDEVINSLYGMDMDEFLKNQVGMEDALDAIETAGFAHGTVKFEDGKLVLDEKTMTYDAEKDTLTEDNPDLVEAYSEDSVTYTRQ